MEVNVYKNTEKGIKYKIDIDEMKKSIPNLKW